MLLGRFIRSMTEYASQAASYGLIRVLKASASPSREFHRVPHQGYVALPHCRIISTYSPPSSLLLLLFTLSEVFSTIEARTSSTSTYNNTQWVSKYPTCFEMPSTNIFKCLDHTEMPYNDLGSSEAYETVDPQQDYSENHQACKL